MEKVIKILKNKIKMTKNVFWFYTSTLFEIFFPIPNQIKNDWKLFLRVKLMSTWIQNTFSFVIMIGFWVNKMRKHKFKRKNYRLFPIWCSKKDFFVWIFHHLRDHCEALLNKMIWMNNRTFWMKKIRNWKSWSEKKKNIFMFAKKQFQKWAKIYSIFLSW